MDVRAIRQLIDRAVGSVRQALRGRLQRAKAGKQVILVQAEGLAGESFNDAEYFQHPGFRSVPVAGMQTIVLPLGGRSANGVVVAVSNGNLFVTDLQPGEVAVFNETDGVANSIILRNGKIIDIKCATLNIVATDAVNVTTPNLRCSTTSTRIEASTVDVEADTTAISGDATIGGALTTSGNATIGGTLAASGDVTGGGKSLETHVHGNVASGTAHTSPPT
jgi:phage baseplate assembly protein V